MPCVAVTKTARMTTAATTRTRRSDEGYEGDEGSDDDYEADEGSERAILGLSSAEILFNSTKLRCRGQIYNLLNKVAVEGRDTPPQQSGCLVLLYTRSKLLSD